MTRTHRLWQCLAPLVALAALLAGGCDELKARRSVQQGNKLYYDRKYDKAVVAFERALQLAPDLDTARYNAGLAHLALFHAGDETAANLKHADQAIAHFKAYLAKYPTDKKVVTWMIGTYVHSGRYEGAVDYYKGELEKTPGNPELMAEIARLNSKAGKNDEAASWQRKRAAAEPTTDGKSDALYAVGQLRWQQLYHKYDVPAERRVELCDDALSALFEAAQITPNKSKIYIYMNLLYRERAIAQGPSWARAVEVASALGPFAKAQELKKAEEAATAGASTAAPAPGTPGQPKPVVKPL